MAPRNPFAISFADIEDAARRIGHEIVRTPVITNSVIDERVGAEVFLKAENLQRTGAFKFRGACNAVFSLDEETLAAGVITYSSGNHGQALATAARLAGSSSVVVMPSDAPPSKIASTLEAGARVVHYDRYEESREKIGERIAAEEGRLLIPPFDWPQVMAGQGTAALELFDQVEDLDALVVCLGGGGLLSGCSIVAEAVSPATLLFGVEPAAGDDHRQSRIDGERVGIEVPRTIADGLATTKPGALTWPVTSALATDFLTVSDDEIKAAMRLLFDEAKLVIEPSGAAAFAAVLHGHVPASGRIAVTLSGGNMGLDRYTALMGS